MKKGKKKWLTVVLSVVGLVTAAADMGLLGPAASRAVGPVLDAVRPVVE